MQVGDKIITNDVEMCNEFNKFFVDIDSVLANKITSSPKDPLKYIKAMPNCYLSSFEPPSATEVAEVVFNLKDSAAGHDEISLKILR